MASASSQHVARGMIAQPCHEELRGVFPCSTESAHLYVSRIYRQYYCFNMPLYISTNRQGSRNLINQAEVNDKMMRKMPAAAHELREPAAGGFIREITAWVAQRLSPASSLTNRGKQACCDDVGRGS